MKAATAYRVGWMVIGLSAMPLLTRASEPPNAEIGKLEWLVSVHDVRYAISASSVGASTDLRAKPNKCSSAMAERGR